MAGVGLASAAVASIAITSLPLKQGKLTTQTLPDREVAKYADKSTMLKV